jgi:hypothetical protein
MIAALDRIEPQVEAMLSGDQKARGDAEETLRELQRLVKKAGGAIWAWNSGTTAVSRS